MSTKIKRAYDFKCNAKCRTKSRSELEKQYGKVNPTLHGYEFDKPCIFPIRVAGKNFYGCIWSESIGPWCYTDVTRLVEVYPLSNNKTVGLPSLYDNLPVTSKWGICSNNCPMEDCPKCNFPFTYKNKTHKKCQKGDIVKNGPDFINLPWCYYGKNEKTDWKFCSDKCNPDSMTVNSMCKQIDKINSCNKRLGHGEEKWCRIGAEIVPVEKELNSTKYTWSTEWAMCNERCPNNTTADSTAFMSDQGYLMSASIIALFTVILVGVFSWIKCKKMSSREFILLQDNLSSRYSNGIISAGLHENQQTSKLINTSDTAFTSTSMQFIERNLAKTLDGDLTKINPHKSLNEQTNVIPYNSKYEIPYESFITGQIIGSGNFGTVFEGEAKILFLSNETTKVAIKTVSQHSDLDQFSSLISEIKILSNLNAHLNLVNMLGCCSSKLGEEGKLWLFLEFCNESDIKTYLLEHSKMFTSGIHLIFNVHVS